MENIGGTKMKYGELTQLIGEATVLMAGNATFNNKRAIEIVAEIWQTIEAGNTQYLFYKAGMEAMDIEVKELKEKLAKAIVALEFIADDIVCSGNEYLLKYINKTLEKLK